MLLAIPWHDYCVGYGSVLSTMEKMNPNGARATTVKNVDEATFEAEVVRWGQPVVVAFRAPWSQPCHILDAVLDEVAATCAGSAKVVKVNADDNPDLSMWYEVQSIPTLLYFHGGSVRAKTVGTVSKEAILAKVQLTIQGGGSTPLPSDTGKENES